MKTHSTEHPESFSKIDYILERKANLNKYREKNEITPCSPRNHNTIKLEINIKIIARNLWRLDITKPMIN